MVSDFWRLPRKLSAHFYPLNLWRSLDIQLFQQLNLVWGQFRTLQNTSIFGKKFSQMNTLQDRSNLIPSLPSLALRYTHQKQGQKAKKDMSLNSFILPMINRPKIQSGLQRPKSSLHFQKLLVSQSNIFRRQAIIARRNKKFPVQGLFRSNFHPIDFQFAAFQLPQIRTHLPMGHKSLGRFLDICSRVAQRSEGLGDPLQQLLSSGLISLGPLWVIDQDETAPPFPRLVTHSRMNPGTLPAMAVTWKVEIVSNSQA